MRKVIVCILAILYMGSSSGATVHLHYCMGQLVGKALSHEKKGPGCQQCAGQENKTACKKQCCQDVHKLLKVDNDHKSVESALRLIAAATCVNPHPFLDLPQVAMASPAQEFPVLLYYKLSVPEVISAIRANNNESGGRKFELNDIGYIIKTSGYLQSLEEIEHIPIKSQNSLPVRIADVATVQMTEESRPGIFDQDGKGERVGGIVVMRYGQHAAAVIEEQRTAYAVLSNEFIALVKKSGLSSGELYVDFCPMAMNDKGASWISAQQEIKNPYFGAKMMTCGEVKETIQ